RICDFLDPESMRDVIRKTFEKKVPHLVEPNIRTFNRGYEEVRFMEIDTGKESDKEFVRAQPLLGYLTQEPGGLLTVNANSVLKDLSGSRQGYVPEFHEDKCIHCAACDTVCPDLCFVW